MKKSSAYPYVFILVATALFHAGGCDQSEDPDVPQCYLASKTTPERTENYVYEGDRIQKFEGIATVAANPGPFAVTYAYDTKGNVIERVSGNSKRIFSYSKTNQLTKIEDYIGGELEEMFEFVFTSNRLSKMQCYSKTSTTVLEKKGYYVYEYADAISKNAAIIKFYKEDHSIHSILEREYDNQKTPLDATPGMRPTRILLFEGLYNNIVKETWTEEGTMGSSVFTYAYEYNSNGYPIKRTVTSTSAKPTTLYTYNCR